MAGAVGLVLQLVNQGLEQGLPTENGVRRKSLQENAAIFALKACAESEAFDTGKALSLVLDQMKTHRIAALEVMHGSGTDTTALQARIHGLPDPMEQAVLRKIVKYVVE